MGIDIATDLGSFKFTAVSMGNPHCVIVVEQDIGTLNIEKIGPLIETHEFFPDKTNVEFVNIINDREIAMRVWERGAGITLACGTGACAVLAAAVQNGLTQREALIHLPGGNLMIEWKAADNHIYMTGPAEIVFTGEIDLSPIN
jgi:diaminopimelate epimerase